MNNISLRLTDLEEKNDKLEEKFERLIKDYLSNYQAQEYHKSITLNSLWIIFLSGIVATVLILIYHFLGFFNLVMAWGPVIAIYTIFLIIFLVHIDNKARDYSKLKTNQKEDYLREGKEFKWGNKMYANTNIKCLGWHKDVSGLVYYLIWDNDVNKIIEVRAWELR